MSKSEKAIVDILTEFGFTMNACKTYISLLKNYPATGYEISTRAGIPRSAIYSVLNRLQNHGLVNVTGQEPKRYVPIAPSALIEFLDQSHQNRLEDLRVAIDKLDTDEEAFDFWHLHGYRNLILKMSESIKNAERKIFLSIWPKDMAMIIDDLKAAGQREVEIFLFSFCALPDSGATKISYGLNESDLLEIWNPKVILVVDQAISIMGSTLDVSGSKAIWSKNRAITEIATNHIVLDITLAGQRLGLDVNPITQKMMRRGDIQLDKLLQSAGI
ncbi:MAG: helix-turn-helix domain-containing protein [Candidatus Neomarinimicrobiota bacterium]